MAEVATFDVPGVGAEPPAETLGRQAIVDRGLLELDRLGWDSYILVADGAALSTAVHIGHARPGAVDAMALGRACLESSMDGERPITVSAPEAPCVSGEFAEALQRFCAELSGGLQKTGNPVAESRTNASEEHDL